MKLADGTCGGLLVKEYAVYKTWINLRYNPIGHSCNNNTKILWLLEAIKLTIICSTLLKLLVIETTF